MREDVIAASCALEHISLLDVEKDKNEITNLLARAIDLAGDNFDVLQICVLTYIALNKIEDSKITLQKLINEDYNIGLNGLLLSRIYCRFDKNMAKYDTLKKRIGEANVMPWIEDDLDADKGYIEYRKKNVVWRFDIFLSTLIQKYQKIFNENLRYEKYSEKPRKILWFKDTDIVGLIIDSLNQYFTELIQLNLFNIQKRENGEEWNDFFENSALPIRGMVRKLNVDKDAVDKYISQYEIHTIMKNHKENTAMCARIDTFVLNISFDQFVKKMENDLKEEFYKGFSVKTAESADMIINSIDTWYIENNLKIPSSNIKDIAKTGMTKRQYFVYEDIVR